MTAWKTEPIRAGRDFHGKQDVLEYIREATVQVHLQGAPLLVTAGLASECASDPATVTYIARRPGRNLAAADAQGDPKLAAWPVLAGLRLVGSLKEALSTVENGTTVGLLKDASGWCFSTTVVNKPWKVKAKDPRAAQADTFARIEVEF